MPVDEISPCLPANSIAHLTNKYKYKYKYKYKKNTNTNTIIIQIQIQYKYKFKYKDKGQVDEVSPCLLANWIGHFNNKYKYN